ncbi:OstA-like protein [Taibaiella soli]|uniref:Organic solvent tolerance-like N-terminal domain-containing protein n=1 Tax=Taibaiella soli TaxID=1649169 RepID=A0A2W2BAQ5_9BACT|nr:OstA-like protein [Taibaiella soli]PZF73299.1 hypothetical protein DN068_09015 [Taibaiella soli]
MIFFVATAQKQQKQQQQQQNQDTSKQVNVIIKYAQIGGGFVKGDTQMNRLVGNVQLEQNGTLMFCDSAFINLNANNVEAFGDVKIVQPDGTQVMSDYLRYVGNTKQAYLKGNVSLTDGKSNLWCEELYYDVGTKIGRYENGGTLQTESTTVTSNAGTYNVTTKDARFSGEVYVTDPPYEITSDELGYNTQTKLVVFYAPAIVTSDKSILHTGNGSTWDGKSEIAHFVVRSSILNEGQYIEADKIDYNHKTGFGHAEGKVISIDTAQKITLYCGIADYNEKARKLKAYVKPVMKKMNGNDSLFIRADTFFSAPVPKPVDTLKMSVSKAKDSLTVVKKGKSKNKKGLAVLAATPQTVNDTTNTTPAADSTAPRYFIGYNHVIIFSDSMQGRCDSIVYSMADSTLRMIKDPVAWFRQSQVTGDTILAYLENNKVKKVYIPNNALLIQQSGPAKAQMFDQVQGKTLSVFFANDKIDHAVVFPNAECIYFSKDEVGAYLGVVQGQSERMRITFKNEEVNHVYFEQDPKHTMSPLTKVNISETRLSRFQWLDAKRPKSLLELFE